MVFLKKSVVFFYAHYQSLVVVIHFAVYSIIITLLRDGF